MKSVEVDDVIKEMIETQGPVIADICVDKEENCFPMIQSGSAHNEMVLNKEDKQDSKSAEKGKILVWINQFMIPILCPVKLKDT